MANRKTATQMLAEACGKPFDEVLEDSARTFYMSPDEAVEYGLIDKVSRTYPVAFLDVIVVAIREGCCRCGLTFTSDVYRQSVAR